LRRWSGCSPALVSDHRLELTMTEPRIRTVYPSILLEKRREALEHLFGLLTGSAGRRATADRTRNAECGRRTARRARNGEAARSAVPARSGENHPPDPDRDPLRTDRISPAQVVRDTFSCIAGHRGRMHAGTSANNEHSVIASPGIVMARPI